MPKPYKWTVLVATREKDIRNVVTETLSNSENKLLFASTANEFFDMLIEEEIDLLIYDPKLPALKALDALRIGKTYHPNVPAIFLCDKEKVDVMTPILEKGLVYRASRPLNKNYLREVVDSLSMFKNNIS